jgi:hypothetical protein
VPAGRPVPLATPGELLSETQARTAAYTEADLQRDGAEFDVALPWSNAAQDGSVGEFTPDHVAGDPLVDAAFAVYNFSLVGYDRNPEIGQSWDVSPALGQYYFGLSNWASNSWHWYRPDNTTLPYELPDIDPYIRNDGELLLVVLCFGTQATRLEGLRIGSQPPVNSVVTSGLSGFVPLSTSIDASGSSDPDGSIAKFSWDLDGDGDFETDKGLDPLLEFETSVAVGRRFALRVTDNDGVSTDRQLTLAALDEWAHSWGGPAADSAFGAAYDGLDGIYVAGTTSSFGAGFNDAFLLRYNLAGELQWQSTWGTGGVDFGHGMSLGSDGNIYLLVGYDEEPAVIKFNPDGELVWAKYYPGISEFDFTVTAIQAGEGFLCFCGHEFQSPIYRPVVVRIDLDGNLEWGRRLNSSAGRVFGLTLQAVSLSTDAVLAVGDYGDDALLWRLTTDGEQLSAETWGQAGAVISANDVAATGPFNAEAWIGGIEDSDGSRKSLLLQYKGGGVARVWDAGSSDDEEEASLNLAMLGSQLLLGGWSSSFSQGSDTSAALLGYDKSGTLSYAGFLGQTGNQCTFNGGLDVYAGGLVVGCGSAFGAQGIAWSTPFGNSATRTATWVDLGLNVHVTGSEAVNLNGFVTHPTGAVIDAGGGSHDCLVVARSLP